MGIVRIVCVYVDFYTVFSFCCGFFCDCISSFFAIKLLSSEGINEEGKYMLELKSALHDQSKYQVLIHVMLLTVFSIAH
ncbi:hypothetical protein Scep_027786 [Stephania cephalantha]|uniref:Uncharacterized protein n=1 Tax=Stephania cephalantha TaxID=152367 RepID=A0AAP0EH19_9MAGN